MTLLGVLKENTKKIDQAIVDEAINARDEEKAIKLKRCNATGCNALMIAAFSKSKYIYPILAAMESLDIKDRIEILKQSCEIQGATALMYAARSSPNAFAAILKSIERLDIKDKTDILKQLSSTQKANALMVAVGSREIKAVQAILRSMEGLERKDKAIILKQCSSMGSDALKLALTDCPGAVVPLVKAHLSIGYDDVLYRFNMILETVSKKRPEDIPELLQAVVQLSCSQQQIIYGTLTPLQYAQQYFQDLRMNTSLKKALREAISHAEVRFHLAALKQKANELDRKIGFNYRHQYLAPASQARQLYDRLNNNYEAFMRGESLHNSETKEKAPSEGARLITVWTDAIEKATPVLAEHRGMKNIVFRLCTLVITPLLWLRNASQGKSFKFFPYTPETDTMHKVNKVMHALQAEYHFDNLHADNSRPPPYNNLTTPSSYN